jgi:hypothetical protein
MPLDNEPGNELELDLGLLAKRGDFTDCVAVISSPAAPTCSIFYLAGLDHPDLAEIVHQQEDRQADDEYGKRLAQVFRLDELG